MSDPPTPEEVAEETRRWNKMHCRCQACIAKAKFTALTYNSFCRLCGRGLCWKAIDHNYACSDLIKIQLHIR